MADGPKKAALDLSSAIRAPGGSGARRPHGPPRPSEPVLDIRGLNVYYDSDRVLADVNLEIASNRITALIGPSGSGKSTLLRCLNRMNDVIPSATVTGQVLYRGEDVYGPGVDAVEVRKRIGMVFERPNPFPRSVFDNVAFGPRAIGLGDIEERVERALRLAVLWDEVKDRIDSDAMGLSEGQQQQVCLARALAVEPEVILMDEPGSAVDPISTGRIEDIVVELKDNYTIVVVAHTREQAARISDMSAFLSVEDDAEGRRAGRVVEYDETATLFTNPHDPRTVDYVSGRSR